MSDGRLAKRRGPKRASGRAGGFVPFEVPRHGREFQFWRTVRHSDRVGLSGTRRPRSDMVSVVSARHAAWTHIRPNSVRGDPASERSEPGAAMFRAAYSSGPCVQCLGPRHPQDRVAAPTRGRIYAHGAEVATPAAPGEAGPRQTPGSGAPSAALTSGPWPGRPPPSAGRCRARILQCRSGTAPPAGPRPMSRT